MNKVGTAGAENKRGDATEPPPGHGASAAGPNGAPAHPPEERFGIRIARDGTWYHEGGPIRRPELVKLFASVLRRDDAGDYWLVTPVERGRIAVDDVPFVAVEMTARGEGEEQVLAFRTNLDDWVEAGPDHPIRLAENPETGEPVPYIAIRNRLEARIARPVYYELVERCVPNLRSGEDEVGLWSRGAFFTLGRWPGE
ncbi:DUF1285 domain-containing protein [Azospirillum sp. ST 5-10]|uniref:DUF1285 domain-containing protein n=1 Tax=unclassified Azospirillum TaxID=2630922 RepID=UPI003F4A6BBF